MQQVYFERKKPQKSTSFAKILPPLLAESPIPVIIFCDPGVDDALMLLQLLSNQTQFPIAGIVPVKGNDSTETCIQNTLNLCEHIGRTDVPVYPGKQAAMTGASVYGECAMGALKLPKATQMKRQAVDGIEFSMEYLKQNKAIIVSTACLTEPAEVLKRLSETNPAALQNIVGVSVMGGVINASQEANFPFGKKKNSDEPRKRHTEANVGDDPIGTKIFFDLAEKHNIKVFLAPLDLTHSILVSETDIARLAKINNRIAECAHILMRDVPNHYQIRYGKGPDKKHRQPIHDAHSSACLLHPELYRGRWVTLDVAETIKPKHMAIKKEGEGNIFLLSIMPFDRERFVAAMMGDYTNFISSAPGLNL